jgi:hypothetical protein
MSLSSLISQPLNFYLRLHFNLHLQLTPHSAHNRPKVVLFSFLPIYTKTNKRMTNHCSP